MISSTTIDAKKREARPGQATPHISLEILMTGHGGVTMAERGRSKGVLVIDMEYNEACMQDGIQNKKMTDVSIFACFQAMYNISNKYTS